MNLDELCKCIALPNPMREKVLASSDRFNETEIKVFFEKLDNPLNWKENMDEMKVSLGEDADGSKILTIMLLCTIETYKEYKKRGISEAIFSDTMRFCTRFINEHYEVYGTYAFKWDWWFPRQISLREFRIGELEYEMRYDDGKSVINIHIPADADMCLKNIRKSYKDARIFFQRFFPEYGQADMVCNSWLLSPVLAQMLPQNSNIFNFQKEFNIISIDEKSNDGIKWVYKREDIPFKELPENTLLQKEIKKHLLAGKFIGCAYGKLHEE